MPSLTDVMRRFRKDELARELVTTGVFERGGSLYLCRKDDESKAKTVKIITIPLDVFERYDRAHAEWSKVQMILDGFPRALRERKPSVRKPRGEHQALNSTQSSAENPEPIDVLDDAVAPRDSQ